MVLRSVPSSGRRICAHWIGRSTDTYLRKWLLSKVDSQPSCLVADWQQFVADKLSAWRQTNLDWLHNFTGPMHIMFYDQLIEDVATHLQDLLRFLRLNVSEQNMACTLEWREGIYRRKRRVINFDPFTAAMKQALRKEQEAVYDAIANSPHKSQTLSVKLR